MPIRIAPRTRRTTSTSVTSRPTTKTSIGQLTILPLMPSPTGTVLFAASGTRRTKPASTSPMMVRNSPMPTPIAVLSCVGTERNTAVRRPVSTRIAMSTPSITTSPIASAQVICGAISNATSAFTPSPAASAIGNRPTTPIRIVIRPATSAVAAANAGIESFWSSPSTAPPRISGFSTTMYAIVKKVARPPRTSRLIVEPRAEISKNRSKPFRGWVGSEGMPLSGGAMAIRSSQVIYRCRAHRPRSTAGRESASRYASARAAGATTPTRATRPVDGPARGGRTDRLGGGRPADAGLLP